MNTLVEASAQNAANASGRWQSNSSYRILLVGADTKIRRLSMQVLSRSGYQMDAAEDGEAGWKDLHSHNYHLLIIDSQLPRLTGLELATKVRFARMALPVIMASGAFDVEELNRSQWLQFAAVLLKPYTTDRLLATVEEVLRASRSVRTRSGICLPVLSETWNLIQPASHWGINE